MIIRSLRGVTAALCAVIAIVVVARVHSAPPDGEWRAWAADKASTRYSPLDQINAATVKNLKIAWRQSANPEGLKQLIPNLRPAPTNYQNTPLMVGGLLYMSTGMGTVAALDPATGQVVWLDGPAVGSKGSIASNGSGGSQSDPPSAAARGVAFWSSGSDQRIL